MQSDTSMGDQAPLLLETRFSNDLQMDCHSRPTTETFSQPQGPAPRVELSLEPPYSSLDPREVVLSTQSEAALKLGTQQLIPRGLAVKSRTKMRDHSTTSTVPGQVPCVDKCPAKGPEVCLEDYDSNNDGPSLRRNRRNQSYRVAVENLDSSVMPGSKARTTLSVLSEETDPSPHPSAILEPPASSKPTASPALGKASTNTKIA
ncbi:hypothetical protein JZ751_014945 [Albula glossodonta]|uniref:Uncharacterized protein n=1 Tax=Albula glossodonta TaxID=121402 RepID=A0A8T2MZ24_9TELE|nr:hypothetical protein JZ751_014945 [Albula glossodonta]